MTPELAIIIAQLLLKYGPALAEGFVNLIHKQEVKLEDWRALFATVKTYESYITGPAPVPA